MSERERIARLLYAACRKYITPEPPRRAWSPTADFLDMADAVLADRATLEAATIGRCAKAACGSPDCGPDHVRDTPPRLWAMCGAHRLMRNGAFSEKEIIRALRPEGAP